MTINDLFNGNVPYPYESRLEKRDETTDDWTTLGKPYPTPGLAIMEGEKQAEEFGGVYRVVEYTPYSDESTDRVVCELHSYIDATSSGHEDGDVVHDEQFSVQKRCVDCGTQFRLPSKNNTIKLYSRCLDCSRKRRAA